MWLVYEENKRKSTGVGLSVTFVQGVDLSESEGTIIQVDLQTLEKLVLGVREEYAVRFLSYTR